MDKRYFVRYRFNGVLLKETPPMRQSDAEDTARRLRKMGWEAEVVEVELAGGTGGISR